MSHLAVGGFPLYADSSDCLHWSSSCFMGAASPGASITQRKHRHLTKRCSGPPTGEKLST